MKKIEEIGQRLAKGQEKLKEIKEKYNSNSEKIKALILEKAGLLADEIIESSPERKKKISDLDKKLDALKKNVESSGPELIDALEKKIQGIQTEKSNEELRLSFEKQKIAGKKIIKLSAELISNLESANNVNTELRKSWGEYAGLHKITGKSVFNKGDITSQGSMEMLERLTSILKWEISSGKPRPCQQSRQMLW